MTDRHSSTPGRRAPALGPGPALLLAALLCHCGRAPVRTDIGTMPMVDDGFYAFSTVVSGGLVQGLITVEHGEVRLRSGFRERSCLDSSAPPQVEGPSPLPTSALTFWCSDTWLAIDLRDPVRASRWFRPIVTVKEDSTCVQVNSEVRGRRRCDEWRRITKRSTTWLSGPIAVRSLAEPPALQSR